MRIPVLILLILGFSFSSICNAQLITWNFTAKVSQKIGSLPELSLGEEITGAITFASDSKNILRDSTTEASYRAVDNIRINVLENKLISKNKEVGFNKILVRNDNPIGDSATIEDVWFLGRDLHDPVLFVSELTPIRISFFFIDQSAQVFDNTELPLQPLHASDFTSFSGSLRFIDTKGFVVVVILEDIVFTPDLLAQ